MEENFLTGDITSGPGGVVNLGKVGRDIIVTVSNVPPQDSEGRDTSEIKQCLENLSNAISSEADLPDEVKEDALKQIKSLAEAVQMKDGGKRKLKARMAFFSLKALSDGVADVAKLAGSLKELLPSIGSFFGLV